jgi:hypothetical protein
MKKIEKLFRFQVVKNSQGTECMVINCSDYKKIKIISLKTQSLSEVTEKYILEKYSKSDMLPKQFFIEAIKKVTYYDNKKLLQKLYAEFKGVDSNLLNINHFKVNFDKAVFSSNYVFELMEIANEKGLNNEKLDINQMKELIGKFFSTKNKIFNI